MAAVGKINWSDLSELFNHNTAKSQVDWSALPEELLHLIAKRQPGILEFSYFRATCKSWRSSAPLSDPPQQLPWLVGNINNQNDQPMTRLRFYSVSARKTFEFSVKKTRLLWGSFRHYLPFTNRHQRTLSLYNPLTRDEYVLPTIPEDLRWPWTVWSSTDSIRDHSIMIVARSGDLHVTGQWAFFNPRRGVWTHGEGYCYSVCYCQGKYFCTSLGFETKVFDASSEELLYTVPTSEEEVNRIRKTDQLRNSSCSLEGSNLVESSGEILRLTWLWNLEKRTVEHPAGFYIEKLHFDGGDRQPRWITVDNISDRIICLGRRNGFSMSAAPSAGFKGGCIYFINPNNRKPYVYDLQAGTVQRMRCPFRQCNWFVPGLCN